MPHSQLKERSEERFSRNAETDTLSLHDALPILPIIRRWGRLWYIVGIAGSIALIFSWNITNAPLPVKGEIGRAVQQECRDRHSFPTRRSSDLAYHKKMGKALVYSRHCWKYSINIFLEYYKCPTPS